MKQQPLFDDDGGKRSKGDRLRDEGIERVVRNAGPEFSSKVRAMVYCLPIGYLLMAENVRFALQDIGVHPHHPNAWGGVWQGVVNDGLVAPTGRWLKPTDPRSHSCKKQEYVRATGYPETTKAEER